MMGARSCTGKPHDGHTLNEQLEQVTILTEDVGAKPPAGGRQPGFSGHGCRQPGRADHSPQQVQEPDASAAALAHT